MINFCDLSPEIVLYIFKYCDLYTLCRLRETCKKFSELILANKIYCRHALVTNQIKKSFLERCQIILESNEKWRISHNWKTGRFKKNFLLKQVVKYIPWLNLTRDSLWISEGQLVKSFRRHKNSIDLLPSYCVKGHSDHDVTKFVYKNDLLLSGTRLGSFWLYSTKGKSMVCDVPNAHYSDVTCVDLNKEIFVTGSRDHTFKIWSLNMDFSSEPQASLEVDIGDKIWSIGFSPLNSKIAIGGAGFEKITPLHIYDLNSNRIIQSLGQNFMRGSGILDLHWEDENILLTCGYDTFLRKWDMRLGKYVQLWMDPHDSAYYCLASDDLYTVMCGSNVFGRVVLWDQRKLAYVQMYYTHRVTNTHRSSPVYSMSFDSCQLFAALDSCIANLDFTPRRGKYSNYNLPSFQYQNCYLSFVNTSNPSV